MRWRGPRLDERALAALLSESLSLASKASTAVRLLNSDRNHKSLTVRDYLFRDG